MDIEQAAERIEQMRKQQPTRPAEITTPEQRTGAKKVLTEAESVSIAERCEARLRASMEREARDLAEKREARWRASRFPRRHMERANANEVHGDEWQAARAKVMEAVNHGGTVALLGPNGTGKTQLAASVAREWCMTGYQTARYWKTPDLLSEWKREAYSDGLGEARAMAKHARIGLLTLDEVQDMGGSGTDDLFLRRIVDARYDRMTNPTILISNLKPSEFERVAHTAIISRIVECGLVVKCVWGSYREAK